jgi:FKBP-type peptidyl-prolyl cis-trans isomerase SlyD
MDVQKDKVVKIQYKLTDDTGEVLDSSEGRDDLAYLHGHSNIIPGLEEALEGKSPGDEVTAKIEPEKGYGSRNDELLFKVSKEQMPSDTDLEVGMQFQAQTKEGQQQIVTLAEIGDEEVTLDANHPLAGENLNFEVTVTDVRDASESELEHGQVEG